MKTITLEIKENGEISIEADGFSDNTCLNHLKVLEELFGESKDVKLKNEAKNRNRVTRNQEA